MKKIKFVLLIVFVLLFACNNVETGKVVGVKASFSLNDAMSDDIKSMYYEGQLVIEKSDGEKINAICEKSLVKSIKGGQEVEIVFDKDLDSWKVVRLIVD